MCYCILRTLPLMCEPHLFYQDGASNSDGMSKKGDEEDHQRKQRRIPTIKKIFEFYSTPFTKFWFTTASREQMSKL